jgi:hypothetical protein
VSDSPVVCTQSERHGSVAQSGQTRRAEDARSEAGESHAQSRSGAHASLLLLLCCCAAVLLSCNAQQTGQAGKQAGMYVSRRSKICTVKLFE